MAHNSYESIKGRALPAGADIRLKPKAARRELTEDEYARCVHHKEFVSNFCPEILTFIKDLVELGMIDGWRNIVKTELEADDDHLDESM